MATGYVHCACRDCFETAIGKAGKAFCHACEEAGCPDYQGVEGMSQECQSAGAYGCDEEEPNPPPDCPVCSGPGEVLGVLGDMMHVRCRDCGMNYNHRESEKRAPNAIVLLIDDDHRCSLADFCAANAEEGDVDIRAEVSALKVGESVTLGGGAAAEMVVTRLS